MEKQACTNKMSLFGNGNTDQRTIITILSSLWNINVLGWRNWMFSVLFLIPEHSSSFASSFNMCFIWDIWIQPKISILTAAYAVSQSNITYLEESSIYPLLHPWAHKLVWLANDVVIDRGGGKEECHSSLPERMTIVFIWLPDTDGYHCWDSN